MRLALAYLKGREVTQREGGPVGGGATVRGESLAARGSYGLNDVLGWGLGG